MGMRRGQRVYDVELTPQIQGAIDGGKVTLISEDAVAALKRVATGLDLPTDVVLPGPDQQPHFDPDAPATDTTEPPMSDEQFAAELAAAISEPMLAAALPNELPGEYDATHGEADDQVDDEPAKD